MKSEPQKFSASFKCGHCSNIAPMRIVSEFSDTHDNSGPDEPPCEQGYIYELVKCPACHQIVFRKYFWHDFMESSDEISFVQLYPTDARMPIGLPEAIERAYMAATKVKQIDANAYGVLIGRVIDLVCKDRNAKGSTLNEKLKDLSIKGELPSKLVEVADRLRGFRNVGAHAELGDLTPEEVPIVEDLCRAILDYVYTAPHLAQRASERLAKLLKK